MVRSLFSFTDQFKRIEIFAGGFGSFFELVSKLGRRLQFKVAVIGPEISIQSSYAIYGFDPPREKFAVIVDSAPALSIISVRDIKLSFRVAAFGIGTVKTIAGDYKIVRVKSTQSLLKFLLIDLVCSDNDAAFRRNLGKRTRRRPIKEHNESKVDSG